MTQPAVVTHRVPHQLMGDWQQTYDYFYWRGQYLTTGSGMMLSLVGANSTNAIYNPAYDYSHDYDCWLLLAGAAGSDTAYDGCWVIERNPNYPATQPEPWRIRNLAVTGKVAANIASLPVEKPRQIHAGFSLVLCVWRPRAATRGRDVPSYGTTEATMWASNQAHRINVITGEMQELPNMPMRMIDGAVDFDEVHNVFVITGIPRQLYPYKTPQTQAEYRQKVRPDIQIPWDISRSMDKRLSVIKQPRCYFRPDRQYIPGCDAAWIFATGAHQWRVCL